MIHAQPEWLTKDDSGQQMPWYTRPFLEILDMMDLKGKRVFEYGCGNSTLWYRSRGAEVVGVDSNEDWASFAGVQLRTLSISYIQEIENHGKFDIVVIDGIYRDDCTMYALEALKPGGMLIIDNWEQPSVEPNYWSKTKELTKGLKMKVYKEPTHPDWKTATWTI